METILAQGSVYKFVLKELTVSKDYFMRQCLLRKECGYGEKPWYSVQTVWIPENFALLDNMIDVMDSTSFWSSNWKVAQVGEERLSNSDVIERGRGYKLARKALKI